MAETGEREREIIMGGLKKASATILLLILVASAGYAAIGSGEITSSQQVHTGKCLVTSLLVITDGTNAATVILYDNTAASGKKIAEFVIPGGDRQGGRLWSDPVMCFNGLYAYVDGTGASCIVEYISK